MSVSKSVWLLGVCAGGWVGFCAVGWLVGWVVGWLVGWLVGWSGSLVAGWFVTAMRWTDRVGGALEVGRRSGLLSFVVGVIDGDE